MYVDFSLGTLLFMGKTESWYFLNHIDVRNGVHAHDIFATLPSSR